MGPAASQTQGYDLRDTSDRGLRRMVAHFEKPGYFALRSFLASASIAAFGEDVMK